MSDGFYNFNFKYVAGGYSKLCNLKYKTIWLTSDSFCFDNTAIEFGSYFKPTNSEMKFRVGMPHKYFSSN